MDGVQLEQFVYFTLIQDVLGDSSDKDGKNLVRKLLPFLIVFDQSQHTYGPPGTTSEQPQRSAWSSGMNPLFLALALGLGEEKKSEQTPYTPPTTPVAYVPPTGPTTQPSGPAAATVPYVPLSVPHMPVLFPYPYVSPTGPGTPPTSPSTQPTDQTALQPAGQSRRRQAKADDS